MDSIKAAKYELIKAIMAITDNDMIAKLNKVLKDGENEVVAYSIDGKPLTKTEYVKEVLEAREEVEAGNFYTNEKMLREIEKW